MSKKMINYNSTELYLDVGNYYNNSRMYIGLVDKYGNSWDDITINLNNMCLTQKNNIFLNSDLSNDLVKKLIEIGLIGENLKTINYNFGTYFKAKVSLKKLKEYDPNGYKTFNKYYNKNLENSIY